MESCWGLVYTIYLGSITRGHLLVSNCALLGPDRLVEGILLLVMTDEEFDAKYNLREPESMEFVFQKK